MFQNFLSFSVTLLIELIVELICMLAQTMRFDLRICFLAWWQIQTWGGLSWFGLWSYSRARDRRRNRIKKTVSRLYIHFILHVCRHLQYIDIYTIHGFTSDDWNDLFTSSISIKRPIDVMMHSSSISSNTHSHVLHLDSDFSAPLPFLRSPSIIHQKPIRV